MWNCRDIDMERTEAKCALAQLGRRIEAQLAALGSRNAALWMNRAAVRLGFTPQLHPPLPDAEVPSALDAWCFRLEVDVIAADLVSAQCRTRQKQTVVAIK